MQLIEDKNFRLFIIEGLSHGAIEKMLLSAIPVDKPNTKEFKVLRNATVLFQERLYADQFNCNLKRVKLKDTLEKLLQNPQIYMRDKFSNTFREAIFKLHELLIMDSIQSIRDKDLFLTAEVKQGESGGACDSQSL